MMTEDDMDDSGERNEWLRRKPDHTLWAKLRLSSWAISAVVLALVVMMRSPYKIPLPDSWSMSFLPPVHALLNTLVALSLVASLLAVKAGRIRLHRGTMLVAMALSVVFLLCYVAYHFTTVETRFGGDGWARPVYFFLLITHIIAAGVSLPLILLTFSAAWTNRFEAHRKLAHWVFPVWLYVAVTGPICYLMLRPYYT